MATGLSGGTAVVQVIADASKLNTTIAAQVKGATSGLSRVGSVISGALSNPIVQAGVIVAGVTAKMGFDFQDAFTRIDAISNASAENIALWKSQIMDLGHQTAQSPKDLADALYFLASAGLKVKDVFPALAASAKASAVGLGDVATIGRVVAQVLNAYAKQGLTATGVTDVLVAATRESTAETDQFGQTLGRLLPISARAGITFGELAGSLSSLSNIGLDVYEAATAMRAAIQAITAPGEKAAGALDKVGISSQQLLDVIHQKGLFGALKLLDAQIRANTGSESEYLRTFRDIIPNVRALTGVLGLTGENAKHVQEIFRQTSQATGDMGDAFSTVVQGPAFQFRAAVNDIKIAGTELGTHVLPVITKILQTIAPLLKIVADHAGQLLLAFIGFKVLGWLPIWLDALAVSIEGVGVAEVGAAAAGAYKFGAAATYMGTTAAASTGIFGKFAAGITGIGAASLRGAAGIAATAYALGDQSSIAQTSTTEMRDLNAAATLYFNSLKTGALTAGDLTSFIEGNVVALHGNGDAFRYAVDHGISYSEALWTVTDTGDELNKHAKAVNKVLKQQANALLTAGYGADLAVPAYKRFGFASDTAFASFKKALTSSVQVAVGQFKSLNDVFDTTPAELKQQLALAVTIAERFHRDLAAIWHSKKLSNAQKVALSALPANMRDAYVQTDDAGKKEIVKMATHLARLNAGVANDIRQKTVPKMKAGGQASGAGWSNGVRTGINSGKPGAVTAAEVLAQAVIDAGARILRTQSPSKVGAYQGAMWVEGIIQGMKSRETALKNESSHIADLLAHQLDNARTRLGNVIDAIKQKLGDKASREKIQAAIAASGEVAAAQVAIELAKIRVEHAHHLEKLVAQATKALDKIVQKYKDFKSSIMDGFSAFQDLGGIISQQWADYQQAMKDYQSALTQYAQDVADYNSQTHGPGDTPPTAPTMPSAPNFQATIQEQVANAQRLAKDLTDAMRAGLSKGLLAQFAAQGAAGADALEQLLANPALIAQLNQAASDIQAAAGATANTLGDHFFGAAIKHATTHLANLSDALSKFIEHLRRIFGSLSGVMQQLSQIQNTAQQAMNNAGGGGGAGGSGGGGGGGGPNHPTPPTHGPGGPRPHQTPPIIVHVNGWVGNDQDIAARIRDELIRVGRNNGGTGL